MPLMNPGTRMISLFLFFGVFAPRVLAGFGVCQPGWEWANNTLQQNPCQVAGALDAYCQGYDSFVLGPLQQGTNYLTPQRNDQLGKQCDCNTVMFSLYMACTACQNVTTQSWRYWSQFCDVVYVTQFPGTIPLGTAVPRWAFLNYTVEDGFDLGAAKAVGGLPESIGSAPPIGSLSGSSTGSGSPSATTVSGNPTGQGIQKSSSTGAIVGGVIGGLGALVLIGVGACIFRRRAMARRDQVYPEDIGVYTDAPASEHGTLPSQLRPYDPSDPTTYPTYVDYGPSPSGPHTTASSKGRYTGAAEL